MEINATFIWQYLSSKYGWTKESTAGMLGNAEAESTINPARPQNNAMNNMWWPSCPGYTGDAPTPTTTHYGFGLWQITPYMALLTSSNKYNPHTMGNYLYARGYTVSWQNGGTMGQMEPQLDWLNSGEPETRFYNSADPTANQAKWYQHRSAPLNAPTIATYSKLTDSPEECAITFYWNFERSGALTPGDRPQRARKWYDFLGGIGPQPPKPGEIRRLKGGKNVWRILSLHRI